LVEEGVAKLKVIVHETHEEPSSPAVGMAAAAAAKVEDASPEEKAFADFLVSIEVPKIHAKVRKKRRRLSNKHVVRPLSPLS